MSAAAYLVVRCDGRDPEAGCPDSAEGSCPAPVRTHTELRRYLRNVCGWTRRTARDLCSTCTEEDR
ncbi:hypothetical protein [Streptomyces clavuligerus]|uniref:hypothetical protein n=1 Tax=Streptomyces clavuligerus TaxID=1901 RepID=UPI00018008BD|nr:hypothetical protein [Streptomyces clavuligerus]EDY52989.1 hypothetical protein SSCG_06071 [Streptomyces clavuligerus]WDN55996.1 hypothetical protein LL058_29360 [Streptomyces clavuligerus]